MKSNSCPVRHRVVVAKLAGALALAVIGRFAAETIACGDYSSIDTLRLAKEAVSTNDVVAQRAIERLRARGPAGFEALMHTHRPLLESRGPTSVSQAIPGGAEEWQRLNRALDKVGGQRDCASSHLYWHTDIEAAKAAARAAGRPILSLRLLGRLDEELSCANSRFFRTALYANAEISARLREHFILHWESVRPVPRLTIDFGDGRRLERTITGNSIHYILDSDGRPIDALPGLYGPKAFLELLTQAETVARRIAQLPDADREAFLRDHHRARLEALTAQFNRDLMEVGARPVEIAQAGGEAFRPGAAAGAAEAARRTRAKTVIEAPMLRNMVPPAAQQDSEIETRIDDATWTKLAALRASEARLDERSLALMRRKHPDAVTAARLAVSKVRVEDPLVRATREFERSMAEDTVRNEYVFHRAIHRWFADGQPDSRDVAVLNRRVYAELFLTPDSDPWLGLKSEGVYSAIEGDGVIWRSLLK